MTGVFPRGYWLIPALISYYVFAALIGFVIYHKAAEAIPWAIGYATGVLLTLSAVALVVARMRKVRLRMDIVMIVGVIAMATSNGERISSGIDLWNFQNDMRNVPNERFLQAIEASDTTMARRMSRLIHISREYQRQIELVFVQINDPIFEQALDPRFLADRGRRDTALAILDSKIQQFPGALAAVEQAGEAAVEQMRSLRVPGMATSVNAAMVNGGIAGMQGAKPYMMGYLDATRRFYNELSRTLRYLNTPQGRPILNSQGRLDFQTQAALNGFLVVANDLDSAVLAYRRSAQAFMAHSERSMQLAREAFTQ